MPAIISLIVNHWKLALAGLAVIVILTLLWGKHDAEQKAQQAIERAAISEHQSAIARQELFKSVAEQERQDSRVALLINQQSRLETRLKEKARAIRSQPCDDIALAAALRELRKPAAGIEVNAPDIESLPDAAP